MSGSTLPSRLFLACVLSCGTAAMATPAAFAQATAPAANPVGTVKSVSGDSITVTTTSGDVTVTPAEGARLVQAEPGATNLANAKTITLGEISVGDRVLVRGTASGGPGTVSASRIVLMKSSDLASLHASQAQDWQRRGSGGLVRTVAAPDLTLTNGARTITVSTTPTTIFRRYTGDSVKFEDALKSSFAEIEPGDQVRVRGDKTDDGTHIAAEEIVFGSFENLAGTLVSVDPATGMLTLKDLATKKTVTVHVTANSVIHNLPPGAAAAFARRRSAAGAPAGEAARTQPASAGQGASGGSGARPGGGAGMDLSAMLNRLPVESLADLKPNGAVLLVASKAADGSATAITILSGVEQILSATPSGEAAPALSPWNLGGGEGESGGGAPAGGR